MTYEEWRPVVGFEGSYEVSNLGRVRSLDRIAIYQRKNGDQIPQRHRGKILRPGSGGAANGHQFVILSRAKKMWVHRLVLWAFTGPPPKGMVGCHNDGEPDNNVHSNLRWDTPANNIKDDFRSGVRKRGNTSRGTMPGNSYARRSANCDL